MEYYSFIWSTATYIEARMKEEIEYPELEKAVGFSYRHIRETFKAVTGVTLSRYILSRRVANSAFDIMHTDKSLTQIAMDYMFDSYDTFTRAFKRCTNHLPSEFRNRSCKLKVGRRRILVGVFGPMILNLSQISEVDSMINNTVKTKDSCILYGVPRVAYTFEGCTPFCVAMKACLNYMGQQVDYAYIMAITGAAFRLRWNTSCWDGGNVDIMNIYEDRFEAFRRAFAAAGRSFRILQREKASKEDFIRFIKAEIDEGRPVIAFGIIGPPEACLVTGYRENGKILLGWNCFQDNQEFAKAVTIEENGYYVTDGWWENECTLALIAVGEKQEALATHKEILENAIHILTKEKVVFYDKNGKPEAQYAGGQKAYDCWAESIEDDREFSEDAIIPLLYERIVCQNDASVMLGEGRYYAAMYLEQVGRELEAVTKECSMAAQYFRRAAELGPKMSEIIGGYDQNEENIRSFAKPAVRRQLATLIRQAKEFEAEAVKVLQVIVEKIY
jgi:AraC-like DNA-binding protein